MIPDGLITKIAYRYDSGWGILRATAIGIRWDETGTLSEFEEPLDRKKKRTGELENIIQAESDFIIVTARKTRNLNDDDDENFQYMLNPHMANQIVDNEDRVKEKELQINELVAKLDENERERSQLNERCSRFREQMDTWEIRVSNLSKEAGELKDKCRYYQEKIVEQRKEKLEQQGQNEVELSNARDKGRVQGSTTDQLTMNAIKSRNNMEEELDKLGLGKQPVTHDELQQATNKIENKVEQLIDVYNQNKQSTVNNEKKTITEK